VLKEHLTAWLRRRGHEVDDRGASGTDTVDYPPLCADVADRVLTGAADWGVVLGGSGQGEAIAGNKIRGIRAALCHREFTTQIARAHNNANVLVIGAKVVEPARAAEILAIWLATPSRAAAIRSGWTWSPPWSAASGWFDALGSPRPT
jgi:ribose 5-phosphate isomerase B